MGYNKYKGVLAYKLVFFKGIFFGFFPSEEVEFKHNFKCNTEQAKCLKMDTFKKKSNTNIGPSLEIAEDPCFCKKARTVLKLLEFTKEHKQEWKTGPGIPGWVRPGFFRIPGPETGFWAGKQF
jgi:hypothetical protein